MKSGMGSGRGLTSFFAGSAARFAATWGSSAAVVCGRVPRRNIISSIPRGGGGGGGGGGGRGGKEERGGDQKGGWRRSDGAGWFHVAGGGGAAALVAAAATAGASGLSRGSDGCEDCSRAAMSQGAARYDYVIVGSGLAAVGGLRGIRAVDGGSSTVLVLSLDKGDDVEYGAAGAGLIGAGKEMMKKVTVRNEAAVRLDADNRLVVLRTGEEVSYSKGCLLATGSERVNVDINEISEDAKTRIIQTMGQGGSVVPAKLSKLLKAHEDKGIPEEPHVTVLGGGNASCLMASEIARTGVSVSLAMEEPGPMSTVLPHYLSMHVMWCMRRLGIQVIPYTTLEYVRGARSYDNRQEVSAQGADTPGEVDGLDVYLGKTYNRIDARRYRTDAIVVIPSDARGDASLASPRENGIEEAPGARGGFVANCELCLRSGVYTAGDAASVPHPILGRVELRGEEHASLSGELAGRNMASSGGGERYSALPFCDETVIGPQKTELGIKIEAVGMPDSSLGTVAFWEMGRFSMLPPEAIVSSALQAGPESPPETSAAAAAAAASAAAQQQGQDKGKDGKEAVLKSRGSGVNSYVGYRSGVVYYISRTGHVVGVVLLNMGPEAREAARQVIRKRVMLPTSAGGLPTAQHGSVLGNAQMDYGESLRGLIPVNACGSGRKAILKTVMPSNRGRRGTTAKGVLGARNDRWTTAIFGTVPE